MVLSAHRRPFDDYVLNLFCIRVPSPYPQTSNRQPLDHDQKSLLNNRADLGCNNPAHKYHCVPDVEDETRLKTVLPDCIMIMNKTISFLDEIYGIPEQLLNEVINFEIKPIAG